MTKVQVEELIAKSPPEVHDQIRQMLLHSFSKYDFIGKHYPHPHEKENLLEIISQRQAIIVDTNSLWKRESKNHLDKAFIITPALAREQLNTEELILNRERSKQGNIFSIGIIPNYPVLQIDRIDKYFFNCFDGKKLSEASKGKGELFNNQKTAYQRHVENERENVRFLLEVELILSANAKLPLDHSFVTTRKACDLPPPNDLKYATDRWKENIKKRVPNCRYNVKQSKALVDKCHLTLLLEDEQIRKEFDNPKRENVFGDRDILFGAVYLGAGAKIMTADKRLTQMAGYAGVVCCHLA
jgi:hypothetical protein